METETEQQISAEEQQHNDAMAEHFDEDVQGLPDGENEQPKFDMFAGMSDEWKEANLKDGRLFGKFDDIESFANSYKKLQDEKALNGSNAKNEQENLTREQNRAAVENAQLGDIANNGFSITEENFAAFEEAGMTREQAELSVLKMEKAANKAYSLVGGKDNYNNLMNWASENLSESQIKAFANETVGDNFTIKPSGEFAIKGLQSMMMEANKNGQQNTNTRINGHTATHKEAVGFSSKAEYEKAMTYLRSNPNDRSAQRDYESKMGLTNMANLR